MPLLMNFAVVEVRRHLADSLIVASEILDMLICFAYLLKDISF